eukprot:Awhi_evm1s14708
MNNNNLNNNSASDNCSSNSNSNNGNTNWFSDRKKHLKKKRNTFSGSLNKSNNDFDDSFRTRNRNHHHLQLTINNSSLVNGNNNLSFKDRFKSKYKSPEMMPSFSFFSSHNRGKRISPKCSKTDLKLDISAFEKTDDRPGANSFLSAPSSMIFKETNSLSQLTTPALTEQTTSNIADTTTLTPPPTPESSMGTLSNLPQVRHMEAIDVTLFEGSEGDDKCEQNEIANMNVVENSARDYNNDHDYAKVNLRNNSKVMYENKIVKKAISRHGRITSNSAPRILGQGSRSNITKNKTTSDSSSKHNSPHHNSHKPLFKKRSRRRTSKSCVLELTDQIHGANPISQPNSDPVTPMLTPCISTQSLAQGSFWNKISKRIRNEGSVDSDCNSSSQAEYSLQQRQQVQQQQQQQELESMSIPCYRFYSPENHGYDDDHCMFNSEKSQDATSLVDLFLPHSNADGLETDISNNLKIVDYLNGKTLPSQSNFYQGENEYRIDKHQSNKDLEDEGQASHIGNDNVIRNMEADNMTDNVPATESDSSNIALEKKGRMSLNRYKNVKSSGDVRCSDFGVYYVADLLDLAKAFDKAQLDVSNMMERDSFSRFQLTELYQTAALILIGRRQTNGNHKPCHVRYRSLNF